MKRILTTFQHIILWTPPGVNSHGANLMSPQTKNVNSFLSLDFNSRAWFDGVVCLLIFASTRGPTLAVPAPLQKKNRQVLLRPLRQAWAPLRHANCWDSRCSHIYVVEETAGWPRPSTTLPHILTGLYCTVQTRVGSAHLETKKWTLNCNQECHQ